MPIRYAGVDLLLSDPDGAVSRWMRAYLRENEASIFCQWNASVCDLRHASILRGDSVSAFTVPRVGLPVGNAPRMPRPRLNSLYHPTGAKRWAHGLFLIDDAGLATIETATADGASAILAFSDGANTMSMRMHLLPPRPVSPPGVSGSRLWMLPLVDSRYYWQFSAVEDYHPTTWGQSLSQIGSNAPTFYSPVVGFGIPFTSEWIRPYESAAVLIDAVAMTLQHRVVRDPVGAGIYGSFTLMDAADSESMAQANLNAGWSVVAGGELDGAMRPSFVEVVYPLSTADDEYGSDVAALSSPTSGGAKAFHVPQKMTLGGGAGLASVLQWAYGDWFDLAYDVTYAGIVPWSQSGFDNYIRWEFRSDVRGGCIAQTRVVSMPPNFGCESLPIGGL